MNFKKMFLALFLTAMFSILATAILAYISMAVMIGPWIESTIALLSSFLIILIFKRSNFAKYNEFVALITVGASIGGILATGCGFAFPTLFFLNKDLFMHWLSKPIYFCSLMSVISFCAGALGLLISDLISDKLINKNDMPFPIGEMTYKLITSQNTSSKSYYLAISFGLSFIYSVIQSFFNVIPNTCHLISRYSYYWIVIPAINIPMVELPMLISIGLISGVSIAFPLMIGILTKLLITMPIYAKYFSHLSNMDFNFSFCSGLMIYSTFFSLLSLFGYFKNFKAKISDYGNINLKNKSINIFLILIWSFILLVISCLLNYFKFSFISQIYIIIFTVISAYQLAIIAGKIGLAPIGRFATFVMIPGLILFKFNPIQITLVSTFVEICGGVCVDSLFGYKTSDLFNIDKKLVKIFQWTGLIISALSVGYIFYILITQLGLGTDQLLAQRCQTRALTVQFQNFDFFGIILGALFCAVLKEFKVNPVMVLGGILMPLDWSVILASFGLLSMFIKKNEEYIPLYSGIFAANSIWIILKALISR